MATTTTKAQKLNARFRAAPPSQRVLMVAKDVLSQLRLRKYRATHQIYAILNDVDGPNTVTIADEASLILERAGECNVCAIGAALLSTVRLANEVSIGSLTSTSEVRYAREKGDLELAYFTSWLNEMFPSVLLDLMENAFEYGTYGYSSARKGTSRMKAIYQNLVDNKGKKFTSRTDEHHVFWKA